LFHNNSRRDIALGGNVGGYRMAGWRVTGIDNGNLVFEKYE
jgi:hypothetical protein